ncbi:UNC93-like protein 7 [Phlyctema vagabunda]|uniref:UNC93-like protein 7 n=1 Tax=Phlyctema vagabunda TaxID=108571 RepID=A0ABR4P5L7_9HELO
MADTARDEKVALPESGTTGHEQTHVSEGYTSDEMVASTDRPSGWMYRERKIGPLTIPWYASPKIQLTMVSFVCFLCPGMFNALGGLGGGGKANQKTADDMNTALYSTFAVFGFFGGSIVNRLGVKLTLSFGGLGYCIYAIALLVSVHSTRTGGFSIFAGALLGVCAGLLWTAQGTIMLSYPHEGSKGRYFAWFWAIFNLGGVIGALIPLGENIHIRTNSTVTDGTYIAFIVLMFGGAVLALFLCNASDIHRDDGTKVVLMKNPTWKTELIGLWETIRLEPYIILLFPMFWSSNWFTTYQFNAVNGSYFNTRTKSLNNVLYWMAQIGGALLFGYCLDIASLRRSVRAKACLAALLTLTMAIWGGGYAFAKTYTRADVAMETFVPMDWKHTGYVGKMFLYIFYGFYDAAWQASAYWFMGALSNSGRKMANYVGFYKGIQSAGAAVMWSLDGRKISFMAEFASNWALLTFSLLCAAPVIFMKIQDHVTVEEDLRFSDETLADVVPTTHPEKHAV